MFKNLNEVTQMQNTQASFCKQHQLPANTTLPQDPPVSLLSIRDFSKKAKVSVAWIYDRMNPESPNHDPAMPERISLSGQPGKPPVRVLESAVDAWILSMFSKRPASQTDQNASFARATTVKGELA